MVTEVLALRTLVYPGKHVLFVVSYVNIVVEKVDYFTRFFTQEGLPVQGYYTDAPITSVTVTRTKGMHSGDTNSVLPDLSVCTIEKTVTLVNALLTEGTEEDLGCVVVDESHMLDDSECVVVLEDMLVQLRLVCADSVKLVFLRTTVPNIKGLAS